MAGLGFVAGGALTGLGEGMMAQARAKREEKLAMLKMEMQRERDDRRHEQQGGLLHATAQDREGNYFGITRSGEKLELGIQGKEPKSKEGLKKVWDEEQGKEVWVRESEAEGKPAGFDEDAFEARNMREDTLRAEARAQAKKEADDKAGWLSTDETDFAEDGGSRAKFIERRTNEILRERKGGKSAASKPAQGGNRAIPEGQGTQASPYKAATQAHIDWFKNAAPKGAVIEVDGKLYTK